VTIFEPVGVEGEVAAARLDELERFHRALKLYRSQNWDGAEMQLIDLQKIESEGKLCATFLQRIAFLRANPPGSDWDGAFTFETK
jgi:adenylate cyclase